MELSNHRHGEQGFTLIEIMVVVFIIGIMVGLAVISIGGYSERLLEGEAQRLYQKIRLVAEEAEYSNNEFGMALVDKGAYQFYRFDEQLMEWVKLDKDFFKPVVMDDGFELALDTSENKLNTSVVYTKPKKETATDYGEKNFDEPDIMFFSDGQVTPFKLSIFNKQLSKKVFFISSNAQSQLDLLTRD